MFPRRRDACAVEEQPFAVRTDACLDVVVRHSTHNGISAVVDCSHARQQEKPLVDLGGGGRELTHGLDCTAWGKTRRFYSSS
jgi:hypothetical protein